MTNDYLFRALLQQNNKVLKGLISSLLHLFLKEIISVEITNPIELGTAINSKTFLPDIKELIAEAAETVYKLSQDEMIRLQCEAREDCC